MLDIGTGTGDIIATYKLNTKNLEVTCSDLSEEYLNVAKEKLKKFSDINYVNCKGEELPFDEKSYDIVTSTYVFMKFPLLLEKKFLVKFQEYLEKEGSLF